MPFQLPDPATPFGARVARRLQEEHIIWLTTVDNSGTPQPNPVWFLWDQPASTMLIYSLPNAKRIQHLRQNPHVALNFDENGRGGDVIVFTGTVSISQSDPPADRVPAYVEKYRELITSINHTPQSFAAQYSVPLRVRPTLVRGH
ncbi:MAG: TIGR03667 family PPOX class F420-dependent oxidoreductase [Ktedonobacteraceae bacterium]|nr:TIGR03667 family PPOX class F420-dependent oxidoreductase [Ktedonobacteraceae bacterium]